MKCHWAAVGLDCTSPSHCIRLDCIRCRGLWCWRSARTIHPILVPFSRQCTRNTCSCKCCRNKRRRRNSSKSTAPSNCKAIHCNSGTCHCPRNDRHCHIHCPDRFPRRCCRTFRLSRFPFCLHCKLGTIPCTPYRNNTRRRIDPRRIARLLCTSFRWLAEFVADCMHPSHCIPLDCIRCRGLWCWRSARKIHPSLVPFWWHCTRNTSSCKCCHNKRHRRSSSKSTAPSNCTVSRYNSGTCHCLRNDHHNHIHHPDRFPRRCCRTFRLSRFLFCLRCTLGTIPCTPCHNNTRPRSCPMRIVLPIRTSFHSLAEFGVDCTFPTRCIRPDCIHCRSLCPKQSIRKHRRILGLFSLPSTRSTCPCKCCRSKSHRRNTRTNIVRSSYTARHCIACIRLCHHKRRPSIHRRGLCRWRCCRTFHRSRCLFSPPCMLGRCSSTNYHSKRHRRNTQNCIAPPSCRLHHWQVS